MLNINRPAKDSLMYGRRKCARDHSDSQGRVVRRKSGDCWFCACKMAPGQHNFDFGELPIQEYSWPTKYASDEERRKAHIARQVIWNRNNMDKLRENQKRYESKPEIKEKRKLQSREYLKIHREEHNAKQRAYYQKNKAEMLEKSRIAYHQKKLKEQNDTISQTSESNIVSGVGCNTP